METALTKPKLEAESRAFRGRGGVSQQSGRYGFVPAFLDRETGAVCFSRRSDGTLASIHMLDGLPSEWVVGRSESGEVIAVKPSVEAGFMRDGRFFTREEAIVLARRSLTTG